jgi:hypothetical protein
MIPVIGPISGFEAIKSIERMGCSKEGVGGRGEIGMKFGEVDVLSMDGRDFVGALPVK